MVQAENGRSYIGNLAARPEVVICYEGMQAGSRILREVALGIEEEGVPLRMVESGGDSEQLGKQAAEYSPLKVGVGIDRDGTLVLHHQRLHLRFPLFKLRAGEVSPERARVLGGNAARMVQGIPFKEL